MAYREYGFPTIFLAQHFKGKAFSDHQSKGKAAIRELYEYRGRMPLPQVFTGEGDHIGKLSFFNPGRNGTAHLAERYPVSVDIADG